MSDLNPYGDVHIQGAVVSADFRDTWLSRKYVGDNKPWARVSIRRGHMFRSFHSGWPGSNAPQTVLHNPLVNPVQFGQIVGQSINDNIWYPDWTPTTPWKELDGVFEIDLSQDMSFAGGDTGGNGICVASVTVDNVAWQELAGAFGAYHSKTRGWLWPWRGWVPTNRPGGKIQERNYWYKRLPNAQILIEQGYGEADAVKTFTGLIDNVGPGTIRPDRITLTARDFGGILVDSHPFMWNMDKRLREPVALIPPDYPGLAKLQAGKQHNWIIVNDATDIIRLCLRWCGFKEWEIVPAGVRLKTAYTLDRSKSFMDVINEVAQQLGYAFWMAEPTSDDLSVGVPVFRPQAIIRNDPPVPYTLTSKMLTDCEPTHDDSQDRRIIRVRGRPATRAEGGRPILGGDMTADGQVLFTYAYWPPWCNAMAGVIKQLTYYNIGQNGVLGFGSNQECAVACLLIAIQIALNRDQAIVSCPGNPAIGLDTFVLVNDEASEIKSRLYVTSRKSVWTKGGDGSSSSPPSSGPGTVNDQLLWSTELTGSLVDNEDWDAVMLDYQRVISGKNPVMHNPNNQDPDLTS